MNCRTEIICLLLAVVWAAVNLSAASLAELPVGFQVNAGALLHWRTRRTGLELLKMSRLPLLGSDCHNLTTRVPNLKEGRSMVERKLGEAFLRRMDENAALVCGLGFEQP